MQEWLQVGGMLAALIWGGAVVRTELRNVREELREFKEAAADAIKIFAATLTDHGERISRIEGRIDRGA